MAGAQPADAGQGDVRPDLEGPADAGQEGTGQDGDEGGREGGGREPVQGRALDVVDQPGEARRPGTRRVDHPAAADQPEHDGEEPGQHPAPGERPAQRQQPSARRRGTPQPEHHQRHDEQGRSEGLREGEAHGGVRAGVVEGGQVVAGRGEGVGEVPGAAVDGRPEPVGGRTGAVRHDGRGDGGERGGDIAVPQCRLHGGAQGIALGGGQSAHQRRGRLVRLRPGQRQGGKTGGHVPGDDVTQGGGQVGREALEVGFGAVLDGGDEIAEVDLREVVEVGQHRPQVDREVQRVALAAQIADHGIDLPLGEVPDRLRWQHQPEIGGDLGLRDGQPGQESPGDGRRLRVDQDLVVEAVVGLLFVQCGAVETR